MQQPHDLQHGDEIEDIMIGRVLLSPHLHHDVERHVEHISEASTFSAKMATRWLFSHGLRLSGVRLWGHGGSIRGDSPDP